MIRILKLWGGLLLTGALVACGGGGGSAGSTGTGTTPGTVTSTVADFAMFMSKNTMNNSGLDSAELTVLAVDANRSVVADAAVTVSVDQNAVFTPTSGTKTNAFGQYKGTVSIGADKRDRDITLTVTVNGIVQSTSVRVSGSKLTLQAAPSVPAPGQNVLLTATLTDSSGVPIAGVPITLGGVPSLQDRIVTTSLTGNATVTFAAPTDSGLYVLTASGNGVSAPAYQLQVFSSNIPDSVLPTGVLPSLSANPKVLSVNSPGSNTNRSTLKFLFLNSNNQPISNVRVRFVDTTIGLPAVGASIASGGTTLYTDAAGQVTTEYIAGQNSSPTDGVSVKACYKGSDFTSADDCPNQVSTLLTVAGQALAISIGDDNLLEKGSNSISYIKRFAVFVADSAGRAVANAPVDISVDLTHYGKGQSSYSYQDAFGNEVDGLTVVPFDLKTSYPSDTTVPATLGQRIWCYNEDENRNGSVDAELFENRNASVDSTGQATLEPRKSDLVVSYNDPNVTSTNASGVLVIKVEYAQRFGSWLAYKVRVSANVAGSQGMAERLFVTDVAQSDITNGSFLTPPYGVGSCRNAN